MLHHGDTFERNNREFRVNFEYDDFGAPWEREDGHGTVSEWKNHAFGMGTKPPKAPGERILVWDRGAYRTYDMQAAMQLAKRDGWGISKEDEAKLAQALGRAPTQGEIRAAAVENDFQFLRGWCNDEWSYVGVVVTALDSDGEATDETESLWGIESNAYEYLQEVAFKLADKISGRLDDAMARDIEESRPDMVAL